MLDWSRLINCRDQIHERYPQIWDLKLIKKPSWLMKRNLRPGMRILDVGAGDREMGKKAKDIYPDILYKRMDVGRSVPHDYYALADIDEKFDLIIFFEVIEHVEFEEGMELLGRLKELLAHEGKLIVSTPNVYHPNEFMQTVNHKAAYSYEELGGIMLSQGFEVLGIYRSFNASVPKYVLRLTLFYPLHRILNVDFARSIVMLAQKRGKK